MASGRQIPYSAVIYRYRRLNGNNCSIEGKEKHRNQPSRLHSHLLVFIAHKYQAAILNPPPTQYKDQIILFAAPSLPRRPTNPLTHNPASSTSPHYFLENSLQKAQYSPKESEWTNNAESDTIFISESTAPDGACPATAAVPGDAAGAGS
jgi:hypothetical protein